MLYVYVPEYHGAYIEVKYNFQESILPINFNLWVPGIGLGSSTFNSWTILLAWLFFQFWSSHDEKNSPTKSTALDTPILAQGDTCTIKAECCVYIPDNSANVSSASQGLQRQIQTMLVST